MSESNAAQAYKKYEAKWGKPPSNGRQLVAFGNKCGLSVRYGEACQYMASLQLGKEKTHKPPTIFKPSSKSPKEKPAEKKKPPKTARLLPRHPTKFSKVPEKYSSMSKDDIGRSPFSLFPPN